MEASNPADDFVPAGLASLGIEADAVGLAATGATRRLLRPATRELLALDVGSIAPERWVEALPPIAEAEATGA